jgi:hypothetical protein
MDLGDVNKSVIQVAQLKLDGDPVEGVQALVPHEPISNYWPEQPSSAIHVIVRPGSPSRGVYMELFIGLCSFSKSTSVRLARQKTMGNRFHAAPMDQILAPQSPTSDSSPSSCPIMGALYLGSLSAFVEPSYLSSHGITHIVHVIDVPWLPVLEDDHTFICYRISIGDLQTVDPIPHLKGACENIDTALKSGGNVLVHCQMVQSTLHHIFAITSCFTGSVAQRLYSDSIHDAQQKYDISGSSFFRPEATSLY